MSAPAGANQVWVWRPAQSDSKTGFRHPSDVPLEDEAASNACFADQVRGPLLARISPATLLQTKERVVLIAEQGATREIPKPFVLPWYEGLLLLEELEDLQAKGEQTNAGWCNDELRALLQQEKSKFKNGQLSSALYLEKRLLTTAVTGPHFLDSEDKEWAYRRERLRNEDSRCQAEGEDDGQYYRIQDVIGYLPPWEAFCHEKCGFYQDFYQVRWDHPFSEVDYSKVENGCVGTTGATWEPDECLPDDLDAFRVLTKKRWADQQKEREQKEKEVLERRAREQQAKRKESAEQAKRKDVELEKAPEPPPKAARRKYNPLRLELITDLSQPRVGHGVKNLLGSTDDAEIKKGWPKSRDEYPPGFGPADPPGCCGLQCDCMEDWHLGRRSLDGGRQWLDTPTRSMSCEVALNTFMQLQEHVMRRGLVSGLHYLEATTDRHKREDLAQVAGAASFSRNVRRILQEAAGRVPLAALLGERRILRMLALGFASDEVHPEAGGPFVPLQFQALNVPPWLAVDSGTAEVTLREDQLPEGGQPQPVSISLSLTSMLPGKFDRMDCGIDPQLPETGGGLLEAMTARVVGRAQRLEPQPLQALVMERLQPAYDFRDSTCREVTFGVWVKAMWEVAVVTRATSVGHMLAQPRAAPGVR
mmetsp:Transcript_17500/g.54830  ORF Transcript_17500/g.54830 Transcript_17500/m.54830 type:complete len:647 (-) Transcript_17500:202-2142(-)